MNPSLLAIRSIGAEFANRTYRIVAVVAAAMAACSLGLVFWLTTFSSWWWLLFIPLVILLSVALGVLVIIKLIIRAVTPFQTRTQKKQTKAFVDKLQRVAEATGTPKFMLLFHIVRDIAAPREDGFIGRLSHDTTSLKRDFTALSSTFR